MKVSMAIGVDTDSGFGKDEGRIVAVKPAGWQWGTEEVKQFLIIEIDLGIGIDTIEDAQKLTVPEFDNGALWWPSVDYEKGEVDPKILSKRRYKIPFVDLDTIAKVEGKTIDFVKVKDMTIEYQPIEKVTMPFSGLIQDKILNKKLVISDLENIKAVGK